MRWLSSLLSLALLGAVHAVSISGSRLLVVLEDAAEQEKYGVFLGDLTGMFMFNYEVKEEKSVIEKTVERLA